MEYRKQIVYKLNIFRYSKFQMCSMDWRSKILKEGEVCGWLVGFRKILQKRDL